MEFAHRAGQPQPTQTAASQTPAATGSSRDWGKKLRSEGTIGKWLRIASVVLLFSVTILVVAIAGLLYYGNGSEARYIDSSKYQAVDIQLSSSSGADQIYFGHIVRLNDRYVVLQDIYYIVPNSTSSTSQGTAAAQSGDYTLIKYGCELTGPYDQLIINREHVNFWENIKSDGTVAKKISEYKTQNPNGPNCSQQTPAASTPSTAPAPAASSTKTTTKP